MCVVVVVRQWGPVESVESSTGARNMAIKNTRNEAKRTNTQNHRERYVST
jgi:hypothetical protein